MIMLSLASRSEHEEDNNPKVHITKGRSETNDGKKYCAVMMKTI
jgi:hypothetical protein